MDVWGRRLFHAETQRRHRRHCEFVGLIGFVGGSGILNAVVLGAGLGCPRFRGRRERGSFIRYAGALLELRQEVCVSEEDPVVAGAAL